MPLFSPKDERTGLHYIQGYLISRLNNYKLKAITFIIQPGTKISSISFTDIRNCEIKFEQLSKGNILQGIPNKIITNCDILFILENQQSIIIEHFNQILVQVLALKILKEVHQHYCFPLFWVMIFFLVIQAIQHLIL